MKSLFDNVNHEKSIATIIKETKSGRNASFKALNWLEKNGFVNIRTSGNQRLVKLKIDDHTMQFKYYFDAVDFKSLDPFVKLVVKILISNFPDKIKSAVLFGSVLSKKDFNDIDILLLGKNLTNDDLNSLSELREKTERVFGVIINFHKGDITLENVLKGIIVFQSSYFIPNTDLEKQYLEYLDWCFELIKTKEAKSFENAVLNLAYCYSYLNNYNTQTKKDTLNFFNKKFQIKNLKELKKEGIKIGEQVFK